MEVDSADLLSRFSYELASVEYALVRALPALIECILVVLACLLTITVFDWRIAAATLLLLPMSFVSSKLLGPKTTMLGSVRSGFEARMLAVLQEDLNARPIIRALGIEREIQKQFDAQNNNVSNVSIDLSFFGTLIPLFALYSVNILLVIIVGIGAAIVIKGELTIGAFFGCISLVITVAACSSAASAWHAVFLTAAPKIVHINDLLTEKVTVADAPDAKDIDPLQHEIKFDRLVFGYSPHYPVLKRITCSIKAGTSVALVGTSGSGKSTMLGLLMRLHDPDHGALSIDGTDIRSVTQASLRRQMGVVMQEAHLFNASIAENIRMGKLDATMDEIEAAARMAEIHDFISQLPDGYDSTVGENGCLLSGGQRQRIAVARALVRKPPILLLDEPTAALDPIAEASIVESIEQFAAGRTVVMVTHRLASIQRFTRIIVLQDGAIVEEGNHAELLAKNGAYRRLWSRQNGFTIDEDGFAKVTPEHLKTITAFSQLSANVLTEVAAEFEPEHFEPGTVIIREGDQCDKFYIAVRGSIEVLKSGSGGKDKTVGILRGGENFGESALQKFGPSPVTLRVQSRAYCLSLGRRHLLHLMELQPTLRTMLKIDCEGASQPCDL
jgi:ATP-binding cassette, subfamily B, bacterial